jgi:hypothetical protein
MAVGFPQWEERAMKKELLSKAVHRNFSILSLLGVTKSSPQKRSIRLYLLKE